jgi:hypothetical protein
VFDGATYDAIFYEELQWLMMEGQALLASEQMGLWVIQAKGKPAQ